MTFTNDAQAGDVLLSARNLTKTYSVSGGTVSALEGVSFDLLRGETLGLVGESGCGKSTLARVIMQLLPFDAGELRLDEVDMASLKGAGLRKARRRFQMIFQDPFASLNPRATVGRILSEPMIVYGIGTEKERRERVKELLDKVGLHAEMADRMPHEFSGGQRQRIGIARAIALNPSVVICDEPVSALDVSIRAQVINLLTDLKKEFGLTYLFISHDLSVVRHVADRVAVMYLGHLVELAPRSKLFSSPAHHYTKGLLDAFPLPDPRRRNQRDRTLLSGEVPSPINPPSGCRFRTRCPAATEECAEERPQLRSVSDGHFVACHYPRNRAALPIRIHDSAQVATAVSAPIQI
ncbi:Oligopeptide ABC transporter, ATP-binding protein OppF (plasmid) [Cupriavidus necator H850]|uniref:ABC transporter ATP-binding protein n=1 Tax=Cupriavidus necator TaxID=106590 RepID=UPI00129E7C30|nr:oligopeptide/dipeptide ABC transporter ATP-binding protein [Cupriavidus necator]KAI3610308.1 Oligopeptide ABC transporter, ATP-binding protein OppF [Cupriavidus necator H850]